MNLSQLLESVLTQPTAPFRESWVKRAIASYCEANRFRVWEDDVGNLWVGAASAKEARRSSLVFVAHLDHPGIVIKGFRQSRGRIFARGEFLGNGPMDIRNFNVKVFSDVNALMVFDGVVKSRTKGPRGPKDVELEIASTPLARAACTELGLKSLGPWGACLWYPGAPHGVRHANGLWITKAADDLAGACALLEAYKNAGRPRGVVALLTRAEESGFHGTLAVLKKKMLDPKRTLMVSVETSSQLPGAELGKGPVVRLGDRATIFSPAFVYWVQARAAELAAADRKFKYQRRVMDGGTCEATAFNCFGFQVAGISVPLFNYHNISKSGAPEPEAVAASDVEGVVKLASSIMRGHRASHARTLRDDAFKDYTARLMANQRAHQRYFNGF
ncbi:MAG: hypothetical protein HY075_03860 [Deltaproteobacteria bacterium]|nr:hypothetical protein [Deltaproteobacteria bacterium]